MSDSDKLSKLICATVLRANHSLVRGGSPPCFVFCHASASSQMIPCHQACEALQLLLQSVAGRDLVNITLPAEQPAVPGVASRLCSIGIVAVVAGCILGLVRT